MQSASGNGALADDLASVEADFPHYRFWREAARNRTRYVARARRGGVNPHTVVTTDLAELRAALRDVPDHSQPAIAQPADAGAPNIAGMYNRWLGGKDNGAADRAAADDVLTEYPAVAQVARANREFVIRAVAHVAAAGVSQFIDIGTGLPAMPAIHHIARHADPGARVAYVDNDPVVVAHARALLAAPGVAVAAGDMRQPDTILAAPELAGVIDLRQPVCVVLASVLHFVTAPQADAIVAALTSAITGGSHLIVSAGTCTGTDPDLISRLQAAYQGTTVITSRTEAEIADYFTGLDFLPPGLTDVQDWRPGHRPYLLAGPARILGAVGRKPVRRPGHDHAGTS